MKPASALLFALGLLPALPGAASGPVFRSHPPMRPLPQPSARPLADGPAFHVDPTRGDDANDGSVSRPWRTLQHAIRKLAPGDTLYLRGGTYYEHVYLTQSGEPGRPITIRSYSGELAILDGGLREFFEDPARAWEPLAGGAPGEYISARVYPNLDNRRIETSHLDYGHEPLYVHERARPLALGFFGDSMVPLHGYRFLIDLRAPEEGIWNPERKADPDEDRGAVGPGVYVGPGVWCDRATGRIHCRLAHGRVPGITNYAGETDPRKIPLVIAGGYGEDVLRIKGIRHVRIQDLVIRGVAGSALINIYGSKQLEFDGLTAYGGAPALLVKSTMDFRVVNCAFRSLAAPWSSRASMKYFGTPGYVIVTHQTNPQSRNWEMAYNEFTDGHDFFWMRFVTNLRFHHNLVDNFNDDVFGVRLKGSGCGK